MCTSSSLEILTYCFLPSLKLTMSGTRLGKLWDFYHKGEAQNSKHYKCYCRGCVAVKLALEPAEDSPEQRFQHGQIKSLL
jgi:hypothetical protein